MNNLLPENRLECSAAAISERLFERPMTFAELAELSEKCDLWSVKERAPEWNKRPLTFVVPAVQLVASISRFVE
ncbi:MAG: hypothetical protein JOZ21_01780 [Verrucomicrobia bacterium]|nr:hypothetical protein [Verrucomicrobiota bacterium]